MVTTFAGAPTRASPHPRAVAVMERVAVRVDTARTVMARVRCAPAGRSPRLKHRVRPERRADPSCTMAMLEGRRMQEVTRVPVAVPVLRVRRPMRSD